MKFGKLRYISCFVSVILLIYCGCTPLNRNLLPILFSVLAHISLCLIIHVICKKCKICFSCFEIKFIILASIILVLYFLLIISDRKFIYYWDYSNYFNIHLDYLNRIGNNFKTAFEFLRTSFLFHDYTCFINFFLTLPYTFGDKSLDSFIFSISVNIVPYILIAVSIYIKTLFMKVNRNTELLEISYLCFMITFLVMPLFHRTILYGQPDAFGLIFIFLLLSISNVYEFSEKDIGFFLIFFFLTLALMLTRRWYLYWIVGYYTSLFLQVVRKNVYDRNGNYVKNFMVFGTVSGMAGILIFNPLIVRIIQYGYSERYNFYLVGGGIGELKTQYSRLGITLLIPICIGIIGGLIDKRTRDIVINMSFSFVLAIILFTRIQNMDYHHTLILFPTYVVLIILGIYETGKLFSKKKVLIYSSWVGLLSINYLLSYTQLSPFYEMNIVSKVYMRVPDREDYNLIKKVSQWILEQCEVEGEAYIIPHASTYNPDIFRNVFQDERYERLHYLVSYGSAVLGTHSFPQELFTAKYIITCSPFDETCSYGLSEKYNKGFLSLIHRGIFTKIKEFDMGNGHNFLVYERIKSIPNEEVNIWRGVFVDENSQYPDLFEEIWNEYLE